MRSKPAIPNVWLFSIYAVVSATLVIWLPYFVPLAPTASGSYLFGYNNRAGIILLLLFTAAGTLWTKGMRLDFRYAANSQPISRRALFFALFAVLVGCLVMYWLAGRYGGFGESSYEIDRIWLTSIGKRPYLDFEWPFGLVLLYGPLGLHHMLPLGVPEAYYLFWALNCLLGVWLLYAVINAIDYPSSWKTSIFLLFYCMWFLSIMNMGTHYTLVRYTLPLYFILTVYRLIQRDGTRGYAICSGAICLFTAILLLYSPETAISFAMAAISLFLLLGRKPGGGFFVALGAQLTVLALLFREASNLRFLDTVKASGTGADSFPIVLCGHILVLFAALFVCACYGYRRLTGQQLTDNSIALIAFSVPMLPAALGRCDPGHVMLNGLGIFLACLFYASGHKEIWKYSRAAFIVILIALPLPGAIWLYLPALGKCGIAALSKGGENSPLTRSVEGAGKFYISHFARPDKKQKWQGRLEALLRGDTSSSPNLSELYPAWHGGFFAPLGYKPNGFGTDLTARVDYGRYEGLENANTPAAVEQKISEIRDNPGKALLLPDKFESYCKFDARLERKEIEFLFAAPYFKSAMHPISPQEPLCQYIEQHYSIEINASADTYFYGLWIDREEAAERLLDSRHGRLP